MQSYKEIMETWTIASSLLPINENFLTLLTQNAGGSFPSQNLREGMICYRTDEKKLYLLTDSKYELWVLIMDLTKTAVSKEYVDAITVPLDRVSGWKDAYTGKVKMTLLNTGTSNGQLLTVGSNGKLPTSLLDTGLTKGKVLLVQDNDLIPEALIPNKYATFSNNRLMFPNGNYIYIG